jgi:pentatricopeptide repeat protein
MALKTLSYSTMITACEVKKDFDAIVYNTIITACGEVNNWVGCATRVTYCLLVSNFIHSGQNELALDAYSEMVRNGFEPGNDTLMHAIISACTKEGKWKLALMKASFKT